MKRIQLFVATLLLGIVFSAFTPMILVFEAMPSNSQFSPTVGAVHEQSITGSRVALAAADAITGTATTQFLPLMTHGYSPPLTCSPDSPFSIQIAALHQVTPAAGRAADARTIDEAFPTLVDALVASGACWTRLRVDWGLIQPDPPPAAYVWAPYHDEKLALVGQTGVQIIAHVEGVPAWAGDVELGPIYQDRLDEFAQFLTDLVTRYKQPPYNIHHWELFNEPDWSQGGGSSGWGGNGDRYAEMLSVAYPAIKAADPDATVLMGGVAYDRFTEYSGPFYRYFPDDVMAAGGGAYLDAVNFHYFPDFAAEWERWLSGNPVPTCGIVDDGVGPAYAVWGVDVIAKESHFQNRLNACFGVDKPVWLTETGEHGWPGDPDSLVRQARYVIQVYARALAAGIQNVTWFALVSPPYDFQEQGLLYKDDFSPKPAFYTYQTLTAELTGYEYAYTLDVAGVEGYVFQDAAAQEKIVAWGSGLLTFAPAAEVRVVDREGNVSLVQDGGPGDADGAQNGAIQIQITDDPVFASK